MLRRRGRKSRIGVIAALTAGVLVIATTAIASSSSVAVADITAPGDAVSLLPGGSENVTITVNVTGNQEGTATFKIYQDWQLSGGVFTGSNPVEFTQGPRSAGGTATIHSTSGTVSVDAGHAAGGPHTLTIQVFDITNTNQTGAKLQAGDAGTYNVTVLEPAAPSDKTAPTITITTPADGATYLLGQEVFANYGCEDEAGGSGLKSCTGPAANGAAIDTATVGSKSFKVDAEDNAENKASLTHNYSVVYDFNGFFQPVENRMTNGAKAGSAIPVKFSLAGNQGLGVLTSAQAPTFSCATAGEVDPVDQTVAASNSGLQYDAVTDQYTYVWKTDKGWGNQCRRLVLTLNDGKKYTADFRFSK